MVEEGEMLSNFKKLGLCRFGRGCGGRRPILGFRPWGVLPPGCHTPPRPHWATVPGSGRLRCNWLGATDCSSVVG
eukprot:2938675-Lingulodinium_polyedra.AAC.1